MLKLPCCLTFWSEVNQTHQTSFEERSACEPLLQSFCARLLPTDFFIYPEICYNVLSCFFQHALLMRDISVFLSLMWFCYKRSNTWTNWVATELQNSVLTVHSHFLSNTQWLSVSFLPNTKSFISRFPFVFCHFLILSMCCNSRIEHGIAQNYTLSWNI